MTSLPLPAIIRTPVRIASLLEAVAFSPSPCYPIDEGKTLPKAEGSIIPITIIHHARERMLERGASEDEVRITLEEGTPSEAKSGRRAKEKVLDYDGLWQGQEYPQKKVRVIYVEEGDELVVLTVYVYYGQWED